MKNKLTKEQAEYLIEKIKCEARALAMTDAQYKELKCHAFGIDDIETVINQCTERPFPAFNIEGIYINMDGSQDHILLTFDDTHNYLHFKSFKEFTANCNKIVKWLEEQG